MTQTELEGAFQKLGITISEATLEKCPVYLCAFAPETGIEEILKKAGGHRSRSLKSWYVATDKALLLRILKALGRYRGAEVEQEEIQALRAALRAHNYSAKTECNYVSSFGQALDYLYPRPPADWNLEDLEDFLAHLKSRGLGGNALNGVVNALLFYLKNILGRGPESYPLQRARKPRKGLEIFTVEEVRSILLTLKNVKHRAMLVLCYSCGLRVGEVVALRVGDLDTIRMSLKVPAGKGRKQREVPLCETALRCLRLYDYEQRNTDDFVFAGGTAGRNCSVRSVQEAFHQAKEKAGVLRAGCMQALRHSYAVHLLDKGTDISLVQQLLGHEDRKTMTRYLHLTTRNVDRVVSPVEEMGI